jgi:hypothetical protein
MGKDEEREELIQIFVTSIKTAVRQAHALSGVEGLKKSINSHSRFDIGFLKKMKLNCGAERYHYSMFNVGRSMFDVHF